MYIFQISKHLLTLVLTFQFGLGSGLNIGFNLLVKVMLYKKDTRKKRDLCFNKDTLEDVYEKS